MHDRIVRGRACRALIAEGNESRPRSMPMPLATTTGAPTRRPRIVVPPHEDEALRLLEAMDAYKRSSGRMFPTWSEVLEVVRSLGYEKPA
jgi:hypothetical protein